MYSSSERREECSEKAGLRFAGREQPRSHLHAELLELLVLGPGTIRNLELFVFNVGEAGCGRPLVHTIVGEFKGAVKLVTNLVEQVRPLLEDTTTISIPFFSTSKVSLLVLINDNIRIVASQLNIGLKMLEPATRFEMSVHLAVQLGPVVNGTLHVTNVDEVKVFVFEGPIQLSIINLEREVGWHPARLSW